MKKIKQAVDPDLYYEDYFNWLVLTYELDEQELLSQTEFRFEVRKDKFAAWFTNRARMLFITYGSLIGLLFFGLLIFPLINGRGFPNAAAAMSTVSFFLVFAAFMAALTWKAFHTPTLLKTARDVKKYAPESIVITYDEIIIDDSVFRYREDKALFWSRGVLIGKPKEQNFLGSLLWLHINSRRGRHEFLVGFRAKAGANFGVCGDFACFGRYCAALYMVENFKKPTKETSTRGERQ